MARAVTERAPASIVALLHAQAAALDAAAALREHRADVVIAERSLGRALTALEECGRAVRECCGYAVDDLAPLLAETDAVALRAAAARTRDLAAFENGSNRPRVRIAAAA